MLSCSSVHVSWSIHVAGCCVYEVGRQAAFMSTFSPHHLTLTAILSTGGPALEAGLVVLVRLPYHRHFTALKQPASVGRGERSIWHALMVETLHINWKPLHRASCPTGQPLMLLFKS